MYKINKNSLPRDQSRYVPSQWKTSLQCNDASHWLGAYLNIRLGMRPANERCRYKCNDASHWLGAYLDWSLPTNTLWAEWRVWLYKESSWLGVSYVHGLTVGDLLPWQLTIWLTPRRDQALLPGLAQILKPGDCDSITQHLMVVKSARKKQIQ